MRRTNSYRCAYVSITLSQQLIIRRSLSSDCFLPALPLFCDYHHDHLILKPILSLSLSLLLYYYYWLYFLFILRCWISAISFLCHCHGRFRAFRLVWGQGSSVNSMILFGSTFGAIYFQFYYDVQLLQNKRLLVLISICWYCNN